MPDLWWGTYPPAGLGTPPGQGEGLWRQRGDDAQRLLRLDAPSFVIAHPTLPLIYAASETAQSLVTVIDVGGSTPQAVASIPTGGDSACHLLLSHDARALYVSQYGSGELAVVRLGDDGLPTDDAPAQVHGHSGSGPRAERQESSHAHFAGYAPGAGYLLVADLGTDELRRYRVLDDGLLEADGIAAVLPPGSGPRHFAVRDQLIYVACELDQTLRTLRWDAGAAAADVIVEQPVTWAPRRTGDSIDASHVVVHGAVLLVSVRGSDVIAVFDLGPEGDARYRTSLDVGHWPRHFAIVGEEIHVGLERGHEVRTYRLADVLGMPPEPSVGAVGALSYRGVDITSPACVVALP
jgi:6-phosphogluconolactonase (cycloisomerase 2 family)